MTLTVGSLYAGVGGICLGFKQAGFSIEWANEFDKFACITYRLNFDHELIEEDVLDLDIKKLKPVDVLCAGFPCQPFSLAGYRKGFGDHRGNHFFKVMDFVDIMRPKAIFLENVKNLLNHDNGNTLRVIENEITRRGYSFVYKLLNTKEYGNIPHNRERIFMVAFDKDVVSAYNSFEFPKPVALSRSISDMLVDEKVEEKFYYKNKLKFYKDLVENITERNVIYQWRRKYVRKNKKGVCPTLTANMGGGGHNVPLILTEHGIRKLTPQECFGFQGFPVDSGEYKLPRLAVYHLYKQAGNSVSVPVVKGIAMNIKSVLQNSKM